MDFQVSKIELWTIIFQCEFRKWMSSEHQYFKDRGKIIILRKEDEFYRKKKKNCISRYLKFDLETKS